MARVWSEEHKLERWLDVELAALDAWAELGVVPEEVARGAVVTVCVSHDPQTGIMKSIAIPEAVAVLIEPAPAGSIS